MKRLLLFAAIVCAALFHSCEYDDSDLVNRMDNLENRIKKLEELCTQMNTNISSLQTIVNAIQKNDHISTIAPITKDGKEIGYSIVFTSGKNITIYHGEDGKDGTNGQNGQDGHTPKIGVKQDSDGNYYWTIDGEWLTDDNGNKIKANGTDGKDGENGTNGNDGQNGENGTDGKNGTDGITPQLKIENEYWYVSYDNGQTWKQLGKATGEDGTNGKDGQDGANGKDGDSFFQSVTQDEDNVYFILADGTVLTVAKKTELALYFDTSSLTEITINSEVKVDYTVVSSAEVVDMEVVPTADLRAEVVADDESNKSGHILIRTGSSYDAASKVIVFVSDGEKVVMKSISLQVVPDSESAQLYVYNGATKNVPASGGTATLSFLTNVECEAVIPDEASSWISIEPTRALEYKRITLSIAQNTSDRRSAKVKVQSLDGTLSVEYTISQAGTASSSTPGVDDNGNILGTPADNEIFYISRTGNILNPYSADVFGAVIVSNTYVNGVGVIAFDRAVTTIGERAFYQDLNYVPNLQAISLPNSVTSIENYAFAYCKSLMNLTIPNNVQTIGSSAFTGCNGLTNITIPNSVTTVKDAVFYECINLTKVTISNSLTSIGSRMFEGCYSLNDVVIPNSVTSIGSRAFYGCYGLTSVVIPNSVKSINYDAFCDCSNLTNVTMSNNITAIYSDTFHGCSSLTSITIPDKVTQIGASAFEGCNSLTEITIPASVKKIESKAFRNCYMLNNIICKPTTPPTGGSDMFASIGTSPKIYVPVGSGEAYKAAQYWSNYADMIVEMGQPNDEIWYTSTDGEIVTPNATDDFDANIVSNTYENGKGIIKFDGQVTLIDGAAFKSCVNLQQIKLPDTILSIGDEAFEDCSGLLSIAIPKGVTVIGYEVFRNCSSLVNVSLHEGVTEIRWRAFSGCTNLEKIFIPNSVTIIESQAFSGCSSLTEINIPIGVTNIGDFTFSNCSNLIKVSIPRGITSIGAYAFYGCSSLIEITIPNSVTNIGITAFNACSSLQNITCKPVTPPTFSGEIFYGIHSSAKIYVPVGSGEAYKAAEGWSNYADIIEEKEM